MQSDNNMLLFTKKYTSPTRVEINLSKHIIDDNILQLLLHSRTYSACGYNKTNDEFWVKNIVKCICIHYFTIKVVYLFERVSSIEFRTYIHNDTKIFSNIQSLLLSISTQSTKIPKSTQT